MTAPWDAYAGRDFVIVRMEAVRALNGSWEAAGCFQRIAWRCERDGEWRATMQEIADEIGVSVRTAKRITSLLREREWITAERSESYNATLTWRVLWPDSESANRALSGGTDATSSESANRALSSTKTVKTDSLRSSTRGTKIPDDFAVTDAMKAWYADQGFTQVQPVMETEAFIDHWRSTGDTRKDWVAAWRNWMRNAEKYGSRRSGNVKPITTRHTSSDPHANDHIAAAFEASAMTRSNT